MKRLIGTKQFYRSILMIAIPIIIQNAIMNFVNLLDNIMIGQVGTAQMSGVAITNQLMFVYNVTIFGAVSGAGIFGAQFFGSGNQEGLRNTFRFKILSCILVGIATIVLFGFGGDQLISFYLNENNDAASIRETLQFGRQYLNIMILGLIPFAISGAYSSTIRETGETVVPMISSISAVLTNFVFNYILIFGMFGAPKLGVQGAAIATVLSRFVELAVLLVWTHRNRERNQFIQKAYRSFRIPKELATKFIIVPAICMPMYAFMHASYFTLRSGGNTVIMFLFDSAFVWMVSIPLAYVLSRYTVLNIVFVYLFCQLIEILKCILGYILVKKGVWLNNMVEQRIVETQS